MNSFTNDVSRADGYGCSLTGNTCLRTHRYVPIRNCVSDVSQTKQKANSMQRDSLCVT